MTFKFRAHHVWFVADKLTLASSWWRILITLCKVWNNITATTFEEFTDRFWSKRFLEIVSRKVRTVTACVLNSLIQWRCAVNVLTTVMCAYCTKRLKDVRLHLVLIHDTSPSGWNYYLCTIYVCSIYQWYITIIVAFLEVVQFPEHHITYCDVLQKHIHCFYAKVWLYFHLLHVRSDCICVGGTGCCWEACWSYGVVSWHRWLPWEMYQWQEWLHYLPSYASY